MVKKSLKSLLRLVSKLLAEKAVAKPDFGNQVSPEALIYPSVTIMNSRVGDYSYVADSSIINNANLGKFCSVGPHVVIGAGEHPAHFVSTSPAFYQSGTALKIRPKKDKFFCSDRVNIGNDVWIGALVYIRNGVTIGDGAVIGTGSIVLKDVEPYTIMIGSPARILRHRFSTEHIARLLEMKWWDWEPKLIQQRIDDIGSDNIEHFVNTFAPQQVLEVKH
jgi:acetyltransferase-like isoleucine patch superfamily enzyme